MPYPDNVQPGSSRDPDPAAQEQPPPLPKGQIVPPAVAGDDVEMLESGAPANQPAGVAERGCLSRVAWIMGLNWCPPFAPVRELPDQPVQFSNKAEEHARETHRLSKLITRVQCFLLPTSMKFGGNEYLNRVLRVCVRFKKECDESCHRCESCGVCPHQYSCSCLDDYKLRGGWCAHIHAMHMLTHGKYKKKMCLYIQTELNYTLMRHVRAFVQRDKFMMNLDGSCYLEMLKDSEMLSQYMVLVKKPNPSDCTCSTEEMCYFRACAACRCRFECNCQDYRVDKQICQHVHSVAMIRQGGVGFKSFDRPEEHLPMTLPDDWNYKYYVELEHEMSFYIDEDRIQEQLKPLPRFMSDVKEFGYDVALNAAGFDIAKSSLDSGSGEGDDREIEFDRWWIVTRKSRSGNTELQCRIRSHFYGSEQCGCKGDNRCARCNICYHDYTCTCLLPKGIVCRHAHAIHRLTKKSQERKNDAAYYIEARYNCPALFEKLPSDFPNWRHRLSTSHMLSEADQKWDILPIPD